MTLQAETSGAYRSEAAGIGFLRRPGRGRVQRLVLLHGVGSNAESFSALMAALPATFDVIAWDAPGYAQSKALRLQAPSPRDYAAVLAMVLDALDLRRVIVVGHSLGALFAGSFAVNYAERVSAVALMSPALGYKVAAGAPLPQTVQSRIDEIEHLGPAEFAAKRAARLVDAPLTKPAIVDDVRKAMAAVHPAGYVQAVRALGAGDLLADAALIRAPVLVAVGAKDVVTPPENARALYAALGRPKSIHEVPRAGHALPQEEPRVVAKHLEEFVGEHVDD